MDIYNAGYGQPLSMPMGTDCAVHKHREQVPLESHHIWPIGMGGPDTPFNRVRVCANAHYSIHEYMRQLILTGGTIPWAQARRYGRKVRALAIRGWTEAGKPRHSSPGE
jgi:hypothetical protein